MARDPYVVLGVSEGASPEEVRKAYREMVRRYHPDQYQGNPLAELAQEKLKEINEAYDTLERRFKQQGYTAQARRPDEGGGYKDQAEGAYAQVEELLRNNNLYEAQQILDSIQARDAQWYYYSGVVCMRQGWYAKAYEYLATAVQMEPGNERYRSAMQQAQAVHARYRNRREPYTQNRTVDPGCINCCSSMLCMDCCCESVGGDCIPCC